MQYTCADMSFEGHVSALQVVEMPMLLDAGGHSDSCRNMCECDIGIAALDECAFNYICYKVEATQLTRTLPRFYILSTGVRPNSFMPLLSTTLALSYNAISATFFSSLSAYITLIVFAFLFAVSFAS